MPAYPIFMQLQGGFLPLSVHPQGVNAMLTGDVHRITLRIALPSLAAMHASGLCTLLDGMYLSSGAPGVSAAVSVCFPLLAVQQAVGFTLGMGAGSHMGRKLGEHGGDNEKSARQCAASALLLAAQLGLLMLAAGLFLLSPLLTLLGAEADVLPHAIPYARALLFASPFSCTGLVLSSLLRAQGKTPANMLAYLVSGAAGAVLGFALIVRQGLGAWGAGISLLAREALAFLLLALFFLRAKGFVRPCFRDVTLAPWVFPAIMRSGLPTLLRQGAASLSGILLSRISAGFGPAVLAGTGLAVRTGALVSSAAIGFGQGFSPVCAANHGAGEAARVQAAYRFCMRVMIAALLAVGAAVYFLSDPLLALFHAEAQVAAFALRMLRAQSAVFFCQGAVILMNMRAQAQGQTVRASLIAVSRQGVFLLPLLLLLPRFLGENGLILSLCAADLCALGFCFLLTRSVDRTSPAHYNI